MSTAALLNDPAVESVLHDCVTALSRFSEYRLLRAVDLRLLWLSENKDTLSDKERDELKALVAMANDRTVDKLQARATLQRLGELFPELTPRP